nr:KAT8 regulatory NSL complex subunit 1-like isoform X2 [Paramormyrops kingsleyae]
MRYQDHFNWLEMSSGASGAGGGAAGALHGAQLCSGGGGCGAVLGYDGAFATLASATTAAPGLHANGAARMRGDWLNASHAESASSTRGNDGRLVDEATDTGSGWDPERPGKYRIEGSGAGNGEGDRLKNAGGINIDYRPSRSQLGGGRRAFMDAALRRAGYTRGELQLGDRRSGGERLSPEDDRSDKRRASSLKRAAKRVCLGRAEDSVHCGTAGSKDAGAAWTCASLTLTPGDDRDSEPVANQRQSHARHGGGGRPHLSGRVQLGDPVKRTLLYRPAATGSGSADDISGTDGRTVGTAKGRVRLYTMPSFVAAAGANGVTHWAPGGVHHALSWVHHPAGDPELQDAGVQCRRFAGETGSGRPVQGVAQQGIHLPREQALVADEAALLCNGKCKRSGCATPTVIECGRTARYRTVVEAGAGESRRRLARLEERTERLQRRLRVVQVKQVERHVVQQLQGLLGVASRHGEWSWTGSSPAGSGELSRLARSCSQALRTAEGGLDSDHTASSSGGESEADERPEHLQDSPEWGWVQERAWLGSRWAWLQAQVSELEYRIRGLSDLYAHLRQGKGRGVHQPTDCLPPVEAPQAEAQSLLPTSSGPHSAAATCLNSGTEEPAAPQLTSAARVRALPSRRRCRLVFPGNISALTAKAVSVQCWCAPPLVCILCTRGMTPSPFMKDAPPRGRAAQLDLSLHPVLSLPSDVHLGLQSAALLRFVRNSRGAIRPISRRPPPSRLAGQGKGSHRLNHPKRRALCPQPRPLLHSTDGASDRTVRALGWSSHRVPPTDLHFHPPTPPAPDTPSQPLRRRRAESSFDIDNLVMPLGLAGLGGGVRLQRLQYKEILTPSWRDLASQGLLSSSADSGLHPVPHDAVCGSTSVTDQEQEEEEDMSDAAFRSRHAQWECREKGRWGRGAHRRRRGRSLCRRGGKLPPMTQLRLGHPPEWGYQRWEPPRGAQNIPILKEDERVCDAAVSPWERRSFPLSESELWRMREEEEDAEEGPSEALEDLVAASARSHSTDSGISVGSLELSPVTPWPPHPPSNSGYPSPLHSTQWSGRGR